MMAVAAWLVSRQAGWGGALALFGMQLALNSEGIGKQSENGKMDEFGGRAEGTTMEVVTERFADFYVAKLEVVNIPACLTRRCSQ